MFNNEGKSLVVQFSVKHEQKIDCGGGYVKASFCNDLIQHYDHGTFNINRYFLVLWILKKWKEKANTTSCLVRRHGVNNSVTLYCYFFYLHVLRVNHCFEIFAGPDICGPGTKKVHVIFNYKDKNLLIKRDITCRVSLLHRKIF